MIMHVQLDPNGFCNSKCWFCPVAYSPNPEQGNKTMDLNTLESILKQLADGRGKFVDSDLRLIYTSHYNEVLLYKNFEEMLQLFTKYNFYTLIFSNGVPLTRSKVDIIKKYPNAVGGILLNIPSYEQESWSSMTKFNKNIFNKLLDNMDYMVEALSEMSKQGNLQLIVNGIDNDSLPESGGIMQPLENMPKMSLDLDEGHMQKTKEFYENRYPDLVVYKNNSLIDRAGYLAKERVISNLPTIVNENKRGRSRVIGCADNSGRTDSWVHINANADVFLCCDDYNFDTVYANLKTRGLGEVWNSTERKQAIKKAYSTLCTNCVNAIWGD